MSFRNYLTGTIFFTIMIFGAVDHESEYGMLIRICQVILIPLIIWLFIGWLWMKNRISKKTETLLQSILSFTISFTLTVFALIEVISPDPWHDDIVRIKWGDVFVFMIFAGFFLYLALAKERKKENKLNEISRI